MQGASSDATQEWGIIPTESKRELLLSGREASSTHYTPVSRVKPYRVEEPTAKFTADNVLLTHVQSGNVMGDASLVYLTFKDDVPLMMDALPEPYNVPVFWDGHPTVSSNGKVVVFASDRTDAIGGTDLWWYVKTSSGASMPRRLGIEINTPCDELSPCFTANDSELLFASAGHATNGGYDIFRAAIKHLPNSITDSLIIGAVENIGLPVNTPADEIFPYMPDAETLYYGSNQQSASDFDVYVLHRVQRAGQQTTPEPDPVIEPDTVAVVDFGVPDSRPKATVTGRVINEKTNEPIRDAEVTARDDSTKRVLGQTFTDTSGVYTLNVPVDRPIEISAQSPELFFDSYVLQIPKSDSNKVISRDAPMSIPLSLFLRVNFPTNIYKDPYPKTLDSNGMETEQDWTSAIELVADNVRQSGDALKRLILIGHTDDVDTEESNMVLGKNRVMFVISELVKRGVPAELLEGRSAGERLTLDRRKDEPIEQWRKRCRRVELVKVMR